MAGAAVVDHPARQRLLHQAALRRAVDGLVTTMAPRSGWALGLAMVWPQPALEDRLRRRAVELWREELRYVGVEGDVDLAPLVVALRERAHDLRRGRTASALGTARLASLLEAAASALARGVL